MKKKQLWLELLLTAIVVIFVVGGCGSDHKLTSYEGSAGTESEPQTAAERDFILTNVDLINVTAYVYNLSERHALCKTEHRQIRKQAAPIDRILAKWLGTIDSHFVGDLERDVMEGLLRKTKRKMQHDHKDIKPTQKQCEELGKKILTENIPPKVRHALAKKVS